MAKNFRFSEDLPHVLWKETLWHNALRAACAGIVWSVVALVAGDMTPSMLMGLLLLPVTYFLFLLPLGLLTAWLSFIPFVWLFAAFFSLIVAVGDPLVFVLSRIEPAWVPVDRPNIFTLQIIVFVMSPFAE